VAALTSAERATLDALAERIIPTDELGPGAVDAGAVVYIERALAGPYAGRLDEYRSGLALLDDAAAQAHGAPFPQLGADDQDALLSRFERSERADERGFFEMARAHVLEGMFGDPAWGGNAGRAGWRLIGYPGPRAVWTEHDQQLDVEPDDEPG